MRHSGIMPWACMLEYLSSITVTSMIRHEDLSRMIHPCCRDGCAGPLFTTDYREGGRSHAYAQPTMDSVRKKALRIHHGYLHDKA